MEARALVAPPLRKYPPFGNCPRNRIKSNAYAALLANQCSYGPFANFNRYHYQAFAAVVGGATFIVAGLIGMTRDDGHTVQEFPYESRVIVRQSREPWRVDSQGMCPIRTCQSFVRLN